jgi:hypothetical protein
MGKNIDVDTSGFETLLTAAAADLVGKVEAEVVTSGKPADYWFIPEVGSRRGRRPWPNPRKKTVLGSGGRVFSKQAPQGFIRKFNARFQKFLVDGYKKFVGNGLPTRAKLAQAATYAAQQARILIRGAAPVDSGDLRNSIEVKPAD